MVESNPTADGPTPQTGLLRSLSISGQTVVVTGAASGIGKATAEVFAAAGARVVGLDLQPMAALDDLPGCVGVRGDITDEVVVSSTVALAQRLGGLDAVVHCAGIFGPSTLDCTLD